MKKTSLVKSKMFATYVKKISANDYDHYNKYQKVRYHCHYTRKYRGAAHSICNLRNKTPKKILVVFHNGFTYDYHFTIN